jgi:hypothetical protein
MRRRVKGPSDRATKVPSFASVDALVNNFSPKVAAPRKGKEKEQKGRFPRDWRGSGTLLV